MNNIPKTPENLKLIQEVSPKKFPMHVKARIYIMGIIWVFAVATLDKYAGVKYGDLQLWQYIPLFVGVFVSTVAAHEGMHAFFFKRYTGYVKFGHKWRTGVGPAFFVTSPNRVITKKQYQTIALAPQILTPIYLATALLAPIPSVVSLALIYIAAFNLGGGCMDIYALMVLWRFPKTVLITDTQEGMNIYQRPPSLEDFSI